ncbi:MAG: hypothetical protein NZ561_06445 [Phycisphaerae bacterium]|nr:hypothetical protein [Phycisphaerae bacterium]MDW8261185.1 hypothetical protein [Phycisphaerales bacterium]
MRSIAAISVLFGLLVPVWADEVGSQIALLTHDSFKVREAAQNHLIETGESCVPQLRAALRACTDEELRSRLELILKRIAEDAILGPTRITLDLHDVPIETAVHAVNAQAGRNLLMFPRDLYSEESGPRVTLQVVRQPLWSVLRELAGQGGLEMTPCEDGIRLHSGCGLLQGPGTVAGPLWITASRLYHQRSIDFNQGALRTSDFGLTLHVVAEPKLRLMPGPATLRLTCAVDDRGNSMLPEGPFCETYGGGTPYWSFTTRLRWPEQPGVRIRRLAGVIGFVAASRFETLESTELNELKDVAVSNGRSRLLLRQVTRNGSRYEVSLAAIAPPGDSAEYNRLQQLLSAVDLRLLDGKGQSILRSSGPNFTTTDSPNTLEFSLVFDRNLSDGRPTPAPAARLIWQVPIETRALEIPFELVDLPLP